MLLNIPLIEEWQIITHNSNREVSVNDVVLKSNKWYISYDNFVGHKS